MDIKKLLFKKDNEKDPNALLMKLIKSTNIPQHQKELGDCLKNLRGLLQSKYLASIYLNTLEMRFHFTIIPKGGCGTVDRDLENVYKTKSILKIVNDDNNCFWYAMACMMNPDKK